MKDQAFDDLVVDYSTRRLGRRQLIRRAVGLGLGATALGSAASVLPGIGRRAAASQSPLDPPPGWLPYLPWPWGPTPGFWIPVPPATARTAGIAWYVGGADAATASGFVVGLTKEGEEVRRFDFVQTGPASMAYSLSEGEVRFDGSLSIERGEGAALRIVGAIDGQPVAAVGDRGGALRVDAAAALDTAKATLLAEYHLIAESIWQTGQTLATLPAVPRSSCVGCSISLGGLSLWGGGCVFSTAVGLAMVCGGGWLVAAGAWADKCEGACAD